MRLPASHAVDVRWVPWLVSGVEISFESLTCFSLEADVGVTQSFEFFFDGILIGCGVRGYHRGRIVDANNVKGVLPREVAQAAMVPTALVSRSLAEGCRQRSCLGFFYALQCWQTLSTTGNLPSMHVGSGETSGTTIVPTWSPIVQK